jgi:hyperosmotically inducible periplasmic protein
MSLLLRLILLIIIVAGVVSVLRNQDLGREGRAVRSGVDATVSDAKEAVANVDVGAISEELKRTGRVVRRKIAKTAQTVAEATEDGRTTAAIKTKLAVDPELSALDISVDTTDGRVTLAGRVPSPEHVSKAVQLALEVDGVHEVVSTLQVRPPRKVAAK